MAEINPPSWLEDQCYTATQFRQVWGTLICGQGVKYAGGVGTDLRVGSTSSAPLTVLVAAGSAFIEGTQVANQGMYHVVNDSQISLTLETPGPTDTRIDLVVARVYDSQYSGTVDEWVIEVVTGDPSTAPQPPDAPPNSLPLAAVTVAPGTVNTSPGMIADLRNTFQTCASGGEWLDVSLASGRGQGNPPLQLQREGSKRRLRGRVIRTAGSGSFDPADGNNPFTMATLPEGDRPAVLTGGFGNVSSFSAPGFARIEIDPAGVLVAGPNKATPWIAFDGLEWDTNPT